MKNQQEPDSISNNQNTKPSHTQHLKIIAIAQSSSGPVKQPLNKRCFSSLADPSCHVFIGSELKGAYFDWSELVGAKGTYIEIR